MPHTKFLPWFRRRIGWIIPISALTMLLGLVIASNGPDFLLYMHEYADTHGGTPDSSIAMAAHGKHFNDPVNVQRRAATKAFVNQQKVETRQLAAERRAANKAALKSYRSAITHNADLSRNQQKAAIKAFTAQQRTETKAAQTALKTQQKKERKKFSQKLKSLFHV